MSDTPETDALVENIGMGCEMVDAWFARKLERERDEARESSGRLNRRLTKAEGRRALANYAAERYLARALQAEGKNVTLQQERDEAREALQKVASLAYGNADKTVCLIHLNAIRRIAVAALKHEEDAK